MFKVSQNLHHLVKEALPDQVTEILDQAILDDLTGDEKIRCSTLEALITVLGIALSCSADLPREKLDMSDVK